MLPDYNIIQIMVKDVDSIKTSVTAPGIERVQVNVALERFRARRQTRSTIDDTANRNPRRLD